MRHDARRFATRAAALALGMLLALAAAAAGAESLSGKSLVMGKDVQAGTIQVNGGGVLHTTAATVFADQRGQRISLAQLPVAPEVESGLFAATGEATIRWEGMREGSRVVLHRVDVVGEPLE